MNHFPVTAHDFTLPVLRTSLRGGPEGMVVCGRGRLGGQVLRGSDQHT